MPQLVSSVATKPHDELILVVKRDLMFPHGAWHGLNPTKPDEYLSIVNQNKEFLPRSIMENDFGYKQIIPYMIFRHNGSYFLMERHAKATEQRLKSKLTLGIGGHIRQEDMTSESIVDWARREFNEEVSYDGALTISPLGILNDDSDDVGKVHMGFVLLLEGDSPNIAIKSELQSGSLVSLEECKELQHRMETWSSLTLAALE